MNLPLIFFACFSLNVSELHSNSASQLTQETSLSPQNLMLKKPSDLTHKERQALLKEKAQKHWLYNVIPRRRSEIAWYDLGRWFTWALFGNEDDGIFGEEESSKFRTSLPVSTKRAVAWTMRNPLHNFNFYVIGSADRVNSEFTLLSLSDEKMSCLKYKREASTVFAGKSTSFFLGFHGWKPFISLRLDYGYLCDIYIGWRERGNFGIKFTPFKKKHKKACPHALSKESCLQTV